MSTRKWLFNKNTISIWKCYKISCLNRIITSRRIIAKSKIILLQKCYLFLWILCFLFLFFHFLDLCSSLLSFGFFLLYYVLLIGGEELADRNQISAAVGMWAPNAVLLAVALYLTLHTVRERAPISLVSLYKKKEPNS